VVITADHPGRWYRRIRSPEKYLIPCVFYGPDVLKGNADLPPWREVISTSSPLVELAAPRGFSYHAVGKDMFNPGSRTMAVGKNLAWNPPSSSICTADPPCPVAGFIRR
jgi:hypothetical protein